MLKPDGQDQPAGLQKPADGNLRFQKKSWRTSFIVPGRMFTDLCRVWTKSGPGLITIVGVHTCLFWDFYYQFPICWYFMLPLTAFLFDDLELFIAPFLV